MMMVRAFMAGLLFLGLTAHAMAADGAAYKEIEVHNGGGITGRVMLDGPVPEARAFPLVLYPFGPFCKKISDGQGNVLLKEFIVGADQGLQDAIVVVQNVRQGKPFPDIKNDFVAVDCMFHPADVPDEEQFIVTEKGKLTHAHPVVAVLQNHRPISVVNKDPIIHNGQVFQSERGNIVLNFPLPISLEPRGGPIHFERGKRIAQMICGMHEFMQSWGFMVDNPYYARTRRDGRFTIDGLPPGTYSVLAWHPHLKPIEQTVTVQAGQTASVDYAFDSRTVVRPHYESQEKFRIGPEARPHEHLHGGECEPPYCSME
ncbi:MAG: carboxypeptidase-like regulatory domain-containing protein [Nitrospirota bacterium]